MINYDWRCGTETQTEGELVEYYIDRDEIIVSSNLAKNEIRLSFDQARDLMAGIAGLLNRLGKRDQDQ